MLAESLRLSTNRHRRWLLAAVLTLALGTALLAAACGGGSSGSAIRITPGGAGATLDINALLKLLAPRRAPTAGISREIARPDSAFCEPPRGILLRSA